MKLGDLRKLTPKLQTALGSYWQFEVYTAKQCEEQGRRFDPPCAYLEATCRLGEILVCPDGEVYVQDHDGHGTTGQVLDGPEWGDRVVAEVVRLLAS